MVVKRNLIGIAVTTLLFFTISQAYADVYVSKEIHPNGESAVPGTVVSVTVKLRTDEPLTILGLGLEIGYESQVLKYNDYEKGDMQSLTESPWGTFSFVVGGNGYGLAYGEAILGSYPATFYPDYDYTLVTFYFNVVGYGVDPLYIFDLDLVDINISRHPAIIHFDDNDNFFHNIPVPDFTYSPAEPCVGDMIYFDASAVVDTISNVVINSYITSWENYLLAINPTFNTATSSEVTMTTTWNFGDGATAQGHTATHAYSLPGSYTVTFEIACTFVTTIFNPSLTDTKVQTISERFRQSKTITVYEPPATETGVDVDLVRRAAWPEQKWNSVDNSANGLTLYAMVHNFSASKTYKVKVQFVVSKQPHYKENNSYELYTAIINLNPSSTEVISTTIDLPAGMYIVTAQALYSTSTCSSNWLAGERVKRFGLPVLR